jgi:hypothetical protein
MNRDENRRLADAERKGYLGEQNQLKIQHSEELLMQIEEGNLSEAKRRNRLI